jgi:hypothetical protein
MAPRDIEWHCGFPYLDSAGTRNEASAALVAMELPPMPGSWHMDMQRLS